MARPSKPVTVLEAEKKSHRTKSELNSRRKAEDALTTGTTLRERAEVKSNPIAHAEFVRLSGLLDNIKKNDAIYETVINRYCSILAECVDLEKKREKIFDAAVKLEKKFDELGSDATFEEMREVTKGLSALYATMISCDKQIDAKRKMLLSIEKENIMTVAAALRTIPKQEEKKDNPLLAALNDS